MRSRQDYLALWQSIVNVSGVADLAQETHGHDLLDGVERDAYGAPLAETFVKLCQHAQAEDRFDFEGILHQMRTIDGFERLHLPDEVLDSFVAREFCPPIGICDHTSIARGTYSDEWGTPAEVLDLVVRVCGPITVDLATSQEHIDRMVAARHGAPDLVGYTVDTPCPADLKSQGVIWCNPPGPRKLVDEFWAVWCRAIQGGATGAFLIFKQDHFRALRVPSVVCTTIALRKRLRFLRSQAEESFLRAEADRQGKAYKSASGASFPSTLVFAGAPDSRTLPIMREHGHVQLWGEL